jgi:hypothetical protein
MDEHLRGCVLFHQGSYFFVGQLVDRLQNRADFFRVDPLIDPQSGYTLRKLLDAGILEDVCEGELIREDLIEPGLDQDGQERMSAQLEEAVANSNPVE